MSQTDLTREYESVVRAFSLGRDDVRGILRDAAAAAFCGEDEKRALAERIDAAFAA